MSIEHLGAVASAVMGVLGTATAVSLLGLQFGQQPSVLLGYALGVALVALAVSLGMTVWLSRTDAERSLYAYPGFVAMASVPTLVAAGDGMTGGTAPTASLALVVGGCLVVVGLSLVVLDRIRASEG